MAGLLDDTYSGGLLDDPLLALGVGLAAAGGPSRTPQSLGGNLAQAMGFMRQQQQAVGQQQLLRARMEEAAAQKRERERMQQQQWARGQALREMSGGNMGAAQQLLAGDPMYQEAQLKQMFTPAKPPVVQEFYDDEGRPFKAQLMPDRTWRRVGGSKADTQLQEVFDPSSPTGTRLVPRSQAAGQPGKPSSRGMEIYGYDQEGRPLMRMGGRAMPGEAATLKPSTATVNAMQKELVGIQGDLQGLREIQRQFRPEFATLPTELATKWTDLKERAGLDVSAKDRQLLQDYTTWEVTTAESFNRYVNRLSGAAVSPHEARRLEMGRPRAGQGPTKFRAALKQTMRLGRLAAARLAYSLKNGLPTDPETMSRQLPLDNMEGLIRKRADAIMKNIKMRDPDINETALKQQTIEAVRNEFGIGF